MRTNTVFSGRCGLGDGGSIHDNIVEYPLYSIVFWVEAPRVFCSKLRVVRCRRLRAAGLVYMSARNLGHGTLEPGHTPPKPPPEIARDSKRSVQESQATTV